jgi:thioredoxin reductase (NADPH)
MTSGIPSVEEMQARRAQMFPKLSKAQLARLTPMGEEQRLAQGEVLFRDGAVQVPMFIVLEGAIEILHPRLHGEDLVTVHEEREFTGESDMLSDRRTLVYARARVASRVLRIARSRVRTIVQTDPDLSETFLRAFILRRMGLLAGHQGDVAIVGSRHSAATLRLQEFLTRNGHPYRYIDVETEPDVQALLDGFSVGVSDIPVVICRGERVLKNPSNSQVAECLGFNASFESKPLRDLVVVGAGPAGLAAAVYGASEGLDVLVLEATAPGGQAGSSSKIENYLGFPTGISGTALAQRALTQAEKFGAKLAIARSAVRLHCKELPYRIELDGGESIHARAIVIATGAQYRKLDVADLARFEGVGVYYGATFVEAQRCESDDVIVVGGGNSAGQAATFLAESSRQVHLLVRSEGLAASMSRYLIRRIEETPNITLHVRTSIVALAGGDHLESVTWVDGATKERTTHPIRHVFTMAGAKPNTNWLDGCLALDDKGFVLTGADIPKDSPVAPAASSARPRYLYETSLPGVFAVGDVRANSVKRVASGVGEGSTCVQFVHRVLAE